LPPASLDFGETKIGTPLTPLFPAIRGFPQDQKAVAYIMGADDLASLVETTEILANPAAMKAIAEAEAGRGKLYSLDDLEA
jgi:hypothetical protein